MLGPIDLWRWLQSLRDAEGTGDEAPRAREVVPMALDVAEGDSFDNLEPLPRLTVGAWAGASSMATRHVAREHVAFAKALGLTRLDVIVNDHSARREANAFSTYPTERIERLAHEVRAAGLELHLMSWIMPFADYIDGAGDQLRALALRVGASSIVLDAEEPWTLAKRPLPYDAAANRIATRLDGIPWGVTGIGYASASKLRGLCSHASYLVPQCYSTSTSGQSPATVVPRLVARWRSVFPGKPIAVGLAAYRQTEIPGFTVEGALRSAYGAADADADVRTAIYWSLASIMGSREVARVLRTLLER